MLDYFAVHSPTLHFSRPTSKELAPALERDVRHTGEGCGTHWRGMWDPRACLLKQLNVEEGSGIEE